MTSPRQIPALDPALGTLSHTLPSIQSTLLFLFRVSFVVILTECPSQIPSTLPNLSQANRERRHSKEPTPEVHRPGTILLSSQS